jgi:dipeptidyl aminopeptidase/acylaminoacyl peptidase
VVGPAVHSRPGAAGASSCRSTLQSRTNGPSRGRYITSLGLQALPKGKPTTVTGLPADPKIISVNWSPDARAISFVNINHTGLSLWIIDVAQAQARELPGFALNGVFGQPCEWLSNNQALVCKTIPEGRGPAPVRSEVPEGPVIQENLGRVTPGWTYEDLLKNPEDEVFFDYYASSQLRLVSLDGKTEPIGKPGIIPGASPSPDGNYVLISERHHPYSYLLPYEFFPERVFVLALKNNAAERQLVDKPLQDNIPHVHDAVPAGPRDYEWRSDLAATVVWHRLARRIEISPCRPWFPRLL